MVLTLIKRSADASTANDIALVFPRNGFSHTAGRLRSEGLASYVRTTAGSRKPAANTARFLFVRGATARLGWTWGVGA